MLLLCPTSSGCGGVGQHQVIGLAPINFTAEAPSPVAFSGDYPNLPAHGPARHLGASATIYFPSISQRFRCAHTSDFGLPLPRALGETPAVQIHHPQPSVTLSLNP